MYFTSFNTSTVFYISLDSNDKSLTLKGDFGTLTIDENSDNRHGDTPSYTIYTLNEIKIYSGSINKFFGGITDFELIITLVRKEMNSGNKEFIDKFTKNLFVSFPVVMKVSEIYYSDNGFFTDLIDKVTKNSMYDSSIFQNPYFFNAKQLSISVNNFNIERTLLRDNYLDYFKQFFFFNSNSINCQQTVSWIFMNDFILINNTNQVYLKKIFEGLKWDITSLSNDYFKIDRFNKGLVIYRNFLIDKEYVNLENELLGLNQNDTVSFSRRIRVMIISLYVVFVLYICL